MKDHIRIGKISNLDYAKGQVEVVYEDKDNTVSNWLPVASHCYRMPKVGAVVCTVLQGNGTEHGVCLGEFFSSSNLPREQGENVLCIDLFGVGMIRYKDEILFIQADQVQLQCNNITLQGQVKITGDVKIDGKLDCSGDVTPNTAV